MVATQQGVKPLLNTMRSLKEDKALRFARLGLKPRLIR